MKDPLKTVLFGFGKIGHEMALDSVMAKYFTYSTHAQVLKDHPRFSWEAVVDPSGEALDAAKYKWNIPVLASSADELVESFQPEVAVIATPPNQRMNIIDRFPDLKAVFVEKPLGFTFDESQNFVRACRKKGVVIQVNFWRRGDEFFRKLATGGLKEYIRRPLAVFGIYGSGLLNNGSHMIDFTRMLFGEIESVELFSSETSFVEGPIPGDKNIHFILELSDDLNVVFQAIPFGSYREIGLDIWGVNGRLSLFQESLGIYLYPKEKNRAIFNEFEIASDRPHFIEPTCGLALYHMYDNLAAAIDNDEDLWSDGDSALNTEKVVHKLLEVCGSE